MQVLFHKPLVVPSSLLRFQFFCFPLCKFNSSSLKSPSYHTDTTLTLLLLRVLNFNFRLQSLTRDATNSIMENLLFDNLLGVKGDIKREDAKCLKLVALHKLG